jgi:hypothetical protein
MSLTSDEILCEACKDLFSDHRKEKLGRWYTLHETGDSFRQALDLSCALCARLYISGNHNDTWNETDLSLWTPITYSESYSLLGEIKWSISFEMNGKSVSMIIRPFDSM